jgi:polysaccharide biosynthesis protein PslF
MTGEMRITLVSGSWPPIKCGVGDFSHRLAQELVTQRHHVSVVTDRLVQHSQAAGIHVLPVIDHWGPTSLPALLSAIKQTQPDVVNFHYPTVRYRRLSLVDLLPSATRILLKTPTVTTIHEYSTFQWSGRRRVEGLVRTSNSVIVPDRENQALLKATLPAYVERIHHIPLGPAIEVQFPGEFSREAWRKDHGLSPEDLLLIYFGFISPSKGIEILLQAVEQLPVTLKGQLCILADREPSVPQYADYHHRIARQIKEVSQRYPVEWTGYLPPESISMHLGAADLAVLPFADGASMRRTTLLACIAHGLPVLSTGDTPPCPGVDVVPIGNAAALTQAIVHLGTDAPALELLRQQSAEAARQISWPAIANETASCLRQSMRSTA